GWPTIAPSTRSRRTELLREAAEVGAAVGIAGVAAALVQLFGERVVGTRAVAAGLGEPTRPAAAERDALVAHALAVAERGEILAGLVLGLAQVAAELRRWIERHRRAQKRDAALALAGVEQLLAGPRLGVRGALAREAHVRTRDRRADGADHAQAGDE